MRKNWNKFGSFLFCSIYDESHLLLGDTRILPLSVCPRSWCTSWPRWFHSCNLFILDWIQDSIIERNRRIRDADKSRTAYRGPNGEITPAWVWAQFWKLVTAGESWFVITLVGPSRFLLSQWILADRVAPWVGILIGVNAALISIATEWLSDIKNGYCADGWWLNQEFCCWEVETDDEFCPAWHPWSSVAPGRWMAYVSFAVRSITFSSCWKIHMFYRPSSRSWQLIWFALWHNMLQALESRKLSASLQASL